MATEIARRESTKLAEHERTEFPPMAFLQIGQDNILQSEPEDHLESLLFMATKICHRTFQRYTEIARRRNQYARPFVRSFIRSKITAVRRLLQQFSPC